MSLLSASLYILCIAFLFGSALYVWSRLPFDRLNAAYAFLALSILAWLGSLFLFQSQFSITGLLTLGRFNFAAAAVMAPATLVFVRAITQSPRSRYAWVWLVETALLAGVSMFTGLVDKAESLSGGQHLTQYGPIFLLYAAHLVIFIGVAVWHAFRPHKELDSEVRTQLRLVGWGLLITALVGITTNVVIPYAYGSFAFINAGTLSTLIFSSAVAYSAAIHHMFDLRIVIRKAVVYGLIVALMVELYQVAVDALTKLLPLGDLASQHVAAAAIAITINAFSHEPIQKWLERLMVKLTGSQNGITGELDRTASARIGP